MGILTDRLLGPIFSGMTIRELFSKISDLIQGAWKSIQAAWGSFLDTPLEKAIPLIKGVGMLVALWALWAVLDSLPNKPARAKKEEIQRDGTSLKDWYWYTVAWIAWVFLMGLIAFNQTRNAGFIIGAFIMIGIFLVIRPAWLRKIDKQEKMVKSLKEK